MSACRSCGRPVRWAVTANGKRMPLDVDGVPGGNVVLHPPPEPDGPHLAKVYRDTEAAVAAEGEATRYLSHFATCPQAGRWRR